MSDRLWFSLAAILAVAMIGFATVWPQGLGARSPGPFGHAPVTPTTPSKVNQAAAKLPQLDLNSLSGSPPASSPASPEAAGLRSSQ